MLRAIVLVPTFTFSGYRGCLLAFLRRCFFDATRWGCRCYFHLSEVGGLAGYIILTGVYLTFVEIGVGATVRAELVGMLLASQHAPDVGSNDGTVRGMRRAQSMVHGAVVSGIFVVSSDQSLWTFWICVSSFLCHRRLPRRSTGCTGRCTRTSSCTSMCTPSTTSTTPRKPYLRGHRSPSTPSTASFR